MQYKVLYLTSFNVERWSSSYCIQAFFAVSDLMTICNRDTKNCISVVCSERADATPGMHFESVSHVETVCFAWETFCFSV